MQFEIPLLQYFQKSNTYSAAKDGMRYFLRPVKEKLLDENGAAVKNKKGDDETVTKLYVTIWPDPWALNRTDPALCETKVYSLDEAGREQAMEWLAAQYQAELERWQNCPGILESEPWYPAPEPTEQDA